MIRMMVIQIVFITRYLLLVITFRNEDKKNQNDGYAHISRPQKHVPRKKKKKNETKLTTVLRETKPFCPARCTAHLNPRLP